MQTREVIAATVMLDCLLQKKKEKGVVKTYEGERRSLSNE